MVEAVPIVMTIPKAMMALKTQKWKNVLAPVQKCFTRSVDIHHTVFVDFKYPSSERLHG